MPVMGFTKFERFFRAAGGVSVDREDVKSYLDFTNDAIYDLLLIGQAVAKANARDIIEPWDLPITQGLQESIHAFKRIEEEIELRPILEALTARPPLVRGLEEDLLERAGHLAAPHQGRRRRWRMVLRADPDHRHGYRAAGAAG